MIKTIIEFVLAPAVGYCAQHYGIDSVFLGLGVLFMRINILLLAGGWGEKDMIGIEMVETGKWDKKEQKGASGAVVQAGSSTTAAV
jgi:hypothetical protein